MNGPLGTGSTLPHVARNGAQLETVIDRALTIAMSPPEGPVYLSLPREVLAEPLPGFAYDDPARRVAASPPAPDQAAVEAAATLLAKAKNPLIITADAGRDRAAVPALAEFAERFAIPVVEHRHRHLCLPEAAAFHHRMSALPHVIPAPIAIMAPVANVMQRA